jgi:dTDP-4-dehydrorhamnose 3,5-epimerase
LPTRKNADCSFLIGKYAVLDVTEFEISDVRLFETRSHGDDRGSFAELYNAGDLADVGIEDAFVQDNLSVSKPVCVLRGLHYQMPPRAQAKLIRVLRGSILDVVVDIRRNSLTYGQHLSFTLSAENQQLLYVPVGFAHGLLTLEPDTEVLYKMSDFYAPELEGGIRWSDPALGINWGLKGEPDIIADRDCKLPLLAEIATELPF